LKHQGQTFEKLKKYNDSLVNPMKGIYKPIAEQEYYDGLHKKIDDIVIPHLFYLVMNHDKPLMNNSDYKYLTYNQPLSVSHLLQNESLKKLQDIYDLSKIQSKLKCGCDKHILIFKPSSNGPTFNFKKDIICSDFKITENESKKYFIQTSNPNYPLIDPFGCYIMDDKGVSRKFKETFLPDKKLHLFMLE